MSKNTFNNFVRELKGYVLPFAKEALKKRGFSEFRLLSEWPQIVGEDLAKVSTPQKISFEMNKKTDGVLHVDVLAVSALEFQHLQPVIMERIATYFGYRAISRFVLHQVTRLPHAAAKKIESNAQPAFVNTDILANCEDAELKERLQSLASALSKNNSQNNH